MCQLSFPLLLRGFTGLFFILNDRCGLLVFLTCVAYIEVPIFHSTANKDELFPFISPGCHSVEGITSNLSREKYDGKQIVCGSSRFGQKTLHLD
ncbi:hypothetical protein NPIL_472551 [Nephila pilipes]|uniref:Uncharacterized protein n=1 Tax=Nephila pilipes TaxID=299642 RepID=A0A8X6Q289_NEPPI|nr:hypothetical protein NPIL_472551 [Nephila pilipes]